MAGFSPVNDEASQHSGTATQEEKHLSPHPEPVVPTTRVERSSGWRNLELKELWRHRELLYFLTWRDIKVRYKQTALGAAWAVLQPFLTMVVFSVVFGKLVKVKSEGVPYPIFSFAALLPWTYFSNALTLGANSVIVTPDLITKVYFPRVVMPAAAVLAGLLDFAVAFLVLVGMMLFYGVTPGPQLVLVIPLLLLTVLTALAVALWLSALNVEYRDVQYVLPFLTQLWLFATPVVYPSSLLGEPLRTVLGLNPMAGVVEGFRWALLGTRPAPGLLLVASAGTALLLFAGGLIYFRRVEDRFADVI